MKQTALVTAFLLVLINAGAQESQQPADQVFFNKEIHVTTGAVAIHGQMDAMIAAPMADGNFEYVGTEMGFGGKTVKGAPYSAEGTTETTQALPDGNRIVHKSTAQFYRDTEGRVRTEQTLGLIGAWASTANPPKTIFINDPVAGVHYVLNPQERSADKLPAPNIGVAMMRSKGPSVTQEVKEPDVKTESLGTQIIEGVQAEGTRTTVTIPAGQIGNEKDLQTISERWYSPDLQTVILRKQSDPRFGDTVYRLTNIQRVEPPVSLFQVPADFTVRDSGNMQFKSVK